jgi:hypothetical protein
VTPNVLQLADGEELVCSDAERSHSAVLEDPRTVVIERRQRVAAAIDQRAGVGSQRRDLR